uniref:Uncharacterized protein n=1 Tax=Romanomermis culicivorax TaxID=13658 RepID=A0A915J145_ROMCU
MKHDFGFWKGEDTTPIAEQKGMEPPSPMKFDDNIDTDKLIIDEDAVKMPDSEMMDNKIKKCDNLLLSNLTNLNTTRLKTGDQVKMIKFKNLNLTIIRELNAQMDCKIQWKIDAEKQMIKLKLKMLTMKKMEAFQFFTNQGYKE